MTPQDLVKYFKKDAEVTKLLKRKPNFSSNKLSMMLVNPDLNSGTFESAMYWTSCREIMSDYISKRAANDFGYYHIPDEKSPYGNYLLTKSIQTKLRDIFSPDKPMCIAFKGISLFKAKIAERLLNSLESLCKDNTGRTKVLSCRLVSKRVCVGNLCIGENVNKPGIIFIIPRCWTETMPHLSLYLLIVRLVRNNKVEPKESFKDFWTRMSTKEGNDAFTVYDLSWRIPNIAEIMVSNWKEIMEGLSPRWYNSVSEENGISHACREAHNYHKTNNKDKYLKNTGVGHRNMIVFLAKHMSNGL